MNLPKYLEFVGKLAARLSPTLLILFTLPSQVLAQSLPMEISIKFPKADNRGTPERTGAGGGRLINPAWPPPKATRGSSCFQLETGQLPLTALMPTQDNLGQTISPTPTLYWYVPQTAAKSGGELVIMNDEGRITYKTRLKVADRSGIVQHTIPATAALEIGKSYQWYFTIICDSEDSSKNVFVSGTIKRTTLGSLLDNYLQQATPLQQAEIYAKNQIWIDTLNSVAKVYTQKPSEWEELLTSVGLSAIAKEPLLDCCIAEPLP
ncbi:DUF928 domain-containing protein [Cronbergia sp. UHCC 0137]|uniref:DUF928 domain-containing protein n=1 Tax=Cronbergia sp. UHCC 0137 TaxID=3110239 RepID=UPI002B20819E|nr:DUF928 domain-containing protein [Cronbergia sp. UHCC 0137]MEA5620746.1 DUF928 domain-containing protein [Cronbergia sp. UHCC 0137]